MHEAAMTKSCELSAPAFGVYSYLFDDTIDEIEPRWLAFAAIQALEITPFLEPWDIEQFRSPANVIFLYSSLDIVACCG